MDATQPTAKLFTSHCELGSGDFIGAFHRWIQEERFSEHRLIDVADYSHMSDGPMVLLVAHECFISIDRSGGRLGLLYRKRGGAPRPAGELLAAAAGHVVRAAVALEEASDGKLRFDPERMEVGFDDRLHAPNTLDTFGALGPELQAAGDRLFGTSEVHTAGASKGCFRALLCAVGPASLAEVAARIAS